MAMTKQSERQRRGSGKTTIAHIFVCICVCVYVLIRTFVLTVSFIGAFMGIGQRGKARVAMKVHCSLTATLKCHHSTPASKRTSVQRAHNKHMLHSM